MTPRHRIVLAVILTVVGLGFLAVRAGSSELSRGSASGSRTRTSAEPSPMGVSEAAPPTTEVAIGPVGQFNPAASGTGVVGAGALRTYDVEVEAATGIDPETFAAAVDAALGDPRSWTADGAAAFQRVPTGGSITVTLATPGTVDQLCAPLQTNGIYSCGQGSRAVINLTRWLEGTADWDRTLDDYRAMVVNHEVGHTLGHGHVNCPGPGHLAPVMMQQSKGLLGCVGNPWPSPDG